MAEVGRASLPLGVMPDAAKTSSAFVCSKRGHVRRGGGCVGRGAASLALAADASKASSSDFDATGRHVGHFVAEARLPPPPPLVCAAERPQPSLVGVGTAAAERLGLLLSLLSLLSLLPRLSPGSERRASRRCWRFAGDERRRMRSAVAGTNVKRRPLCDAPGGGGDGLGGTAAGAHRVPFDPRPAAFRGAFGAVPGLVSGAASAAAASGIAPDAGESDAPPSQQGMATRVTRKL